MDVHLLGFASVTISWLNTKACILWKTPGQVELSCFQTLIATMIETPNEAPEMKPNPPNEFHQPAGTYQNVPTPRAVWVCLG